MEIHECVIAQHADGHSLFHNLHRILKSRCTRNKQLVLVEIHYKQQLLRIPPPAPQTMLVFMWIQSVRQILLVDWKILGQTGSVSGECLYVTVQPLTCLWISPFLCVPSLRSLRSLPSLDIYKVNSCYSTLTLICTAEGFVQTFLLTWHAVTQSIKITTPSGLATPLH